MADDGSDQLGVSSDASPEGGGLPQGTVTLAFTDIEGSTQQVAEVGDGVWARLLETHRRLLRATFANGIEVNTEGDSFFVAFTSAGEALEAVIAAQQALNSHPWPDGRALRVRMGLHTGQVLVRDGDYVGQQVHRASRICDAAHGGQVLVSETTAALVRDELPAGVDLVDVGRHRLKDLGRPQQLFAVSASGLRADLAPRSLEAVANNLPEQRSVFIGRSAEIARVRELLGGHRLVTLTGVGGAGKTRLALQVGAEELDGHPDGGFFVDLAAVSDPELVARTVADAAGVPLAGSGSERPESELLVGALSRRGCLLVLDNCEHLLDACAELADAILGSCSGVWVLATSREPLGVEGEQVFRVPSLSLPEEEGEARSSEAVELFIERAQAADPNFALQPDEVAALAAICRRLDGIPLAIEFAAARVTHLSIGQLAERLDDRFRLLTGGRRRVRRQQTLEAALDWSYQLLAEPEQALLRGLGVFAGGFGLEMAEAVCATQGVDRVEVLDLLGSLVAKSLVATDTIEGQVRYRLLETIRSYAEARLADADEAESSRTAHRDAYLAWLESLSWEELHFDAEVLQTLALELPNLRAALGWSQAQGRRDLVGRMAARCMQLWWTEGHNTEGRRWLSWALEDPDALEPTDRAICHLALDTTLRADLRVTVQQAQDYLARAMELDHETLDGLLGNGLVVHAVANRALVAGLAYRGTRDPAYDRQARMLAQDLTRAIQQYGSPWSLRGWNDHGLTMLLLDDFATAERSLAAVVEESAGRTTPELTWAGGQLATCRLLLGDPQGALDAVDAANKLAPSGLRVWALNFSASALASLQLGRTRDAAFYLDKALEVAQPELAREFQTCLLHAGVIAYELGDPHTASRLLAAGLQLGTAVSEVQPFQSPAPAAIYFHYLPLVRDALDPEEARQCRDEGRAMTPREARARAVELVDELERLHTT